MITKDGCIVKRLIPRNAPVIERVVTKEPEALWNRGSLYVGRTSWFAVFDMSVDVVSNSCLRLKEPFAIENGRTNSG
jgi:hypothetical protein